MYSFSSLPTPVAGVTWGRSVPYAGLSTVHISKIYFVLEEYDFWSNALRQGRWETIHKDENPDYKMSRQDWLQVEGKEMNILGSYCLAMHSLCRLCRLPQPGTNCPARFTTLERESDSSHSKQPGTFTNPKWFLLDELHRLSEDLKSFDNPLFNLDTVVSVQVGTVWPLQKESL